VTEKQSGREGSANTTCWDNTRGCLGGDEQERVTYSHGYVSRYDVGRLHRLGYLLVLRGTLLDSPFLWGQLAFQLACVYGLVYVAPRALGKPRARKRRARAERTPAMRRSHRSSTLVLRTGARYRRAHPLPRTRRGVSSVGHCFVWPGAEGVEIAADQSESVKSVLVAMQYLAAFFLGFFVQTVLNRWSVLRLNVIGAYYGAAANISTMAGHVWAGADEHNRAMRKRTLRYLLLTLSLMFTEARGEKNLQVFEDADMLMVEERRVLEALPRKAQAVAGWLLHHFHTATCAS
jgi:hypothetical protein